MKTLINLLIAFLLCFGVISAPNKMGDPTIGCKNMLKQLNKNNDGKISHDEFMYIYKKDAAPGERNFKWHDKNTDGFITQEEYLSNFQKKSKAM